MNIIILWPEYMYGFFGNISYTMAKCLGAFVHRSLGDQKFPKNEQPKCLKISRNQESGKACDLPCKKKIFQGLLILEEICDILKEVNQLVDLFVSRSVTQLSERISSISNQRLSTYCKCLFLNPDKWCVVSPTNSCQGRVLHSFYIRCG